MYASVLLYLCWFLITVKRKEYTIKGYGNKANEQTKGSEFGDQRRKNGVGGWGDCGNIKTVCEIVNIIQEI
jgi:hypothetical protein